jgi:RNA polymerase sigma-B factor
LLRDWDLLQREVVPPLLNLERERHPRAWSIGSLEDAVSIGVAYQHARGENPGATAAGAEASRIEIYTDGAGSDLTEHGFSRADLGLVPPEVQATCFVKRDRRWIADDSIAEQVLLSGPEQSVDLVTLRATGPGDHSQLDGRLVERAMTALRAGGQLLVMAPASELRLSGLHPVLRTDHGAMFEKAGGQHDTVPGRSGPILSDDEPASPESLARRRTLEQLVQEHIRLATWLAKRFAHRGEPIEELEQVAMLALVKAAKRFDPTRETRFATYATTSILGELKRHFRDKVWVLRVPRPVQELYLEVKRAREELTHKLNTTPTYAQIADHLDTTEDAVRDAVDAGGNFWPAPLEGRNRDDPAIDIPSTDTSFDGTLDLIQLERLLPTLEPREILILRRIYFEDRTQREVAAEIGVSQMQVSRLLARALAKLRS